VTDGKPHGKELSQDRQKGSPENHCEGEALPLRRVSQAQPETGNNLRPLVLPELPPRKRRHPAMKILFLHGWQSVPGGIKPTYLAAHGHEVINPALPDDDFAEAVRMAQAQFDIHKPPVVVGSSRGGAVAMNIDCGTAKLVLLCPAWKKFGTARTVKAGSVILHSRADDVVPFSASEELVRNSGLPPSALIEVGNDHRLADPEPLERMLRVCEAATGFRAS
jgi:pimeloyl-ACP methyl ester carboxylesterase